VPLQIGQHALSLAQHVRHKRCPSEQVKIGGVLVLKHTGHSNCGSSSSEKLRESNGLGARTIFIILLAEEDDLELRGVCGLT
jgi:hypothetical protein